MTKEAARLEPCPFCQSARVGLASSAAEIMHYVECLDCLARGAEDDDPEVAARLWNTRALAPSLPSWRDAMEAAAKVAREDNTPGYGPHRADMESLAETQRRNIAERILALHPPPGSANGERGTIMLEMAEADETHQMWERRWRTLPNLYAIDRCFADRDGRWGLRDFLDYAGQACGFQAGGTPPAPVETGEAIKQCDDCPYMLPSRIARCPLCPHRPSAMPAAERGGVPDDVRRIVIAARRVLDASDWASHDGERRARFRTLDKASEAFAARVPWEDEPDDALKVQP